MDQFEYIMVLISIIVGLGIAHILIGVGGIIDRRANAQKPLELSVAHAAWLSTIFGWLVLFWWWEFRFSSRVTEWTIGLYLFLVAFSVTLFLMSVVLVPRSWDGVTSLADHFMRRRKWFFSLWATANVLDFIDSLLKGGLTYVIEGTGIFSYGMQALAIPIAIVAIRTSNQRFHNALAVVVMIWIYMHAVDMSPILTM